MAPAHCGCLWHFAESCALVGMMEHARCHDLWKAVKQPRSVLM